MFLPIKRILDKLKINFDKILKNDNLKNIFIEDIESYYRISFNKDFNFIDVEQLENKIIELVNPRSVMFHHFHNSNFPKYSQGSISDIQFENLIKKIGRDNILDGDIWLEKYSKGDLKKGETCITIDDGLKCQYIVILPILIKYNIKAIWFIYTNPLIGNTEILEIYKYFVGNVYKKFELFYKDFFDICLKDDEIMDECNNFVESNNYLKNFPIFTFNDRKFRYLRDKVISKDKFKQLIIKLATLKKFNINESINKIWINDKDLINLNNTQVIGIHSHTHPTQMEDKTYKEQYYEYETSKNILENILGKKIDVLSYPCGKFNTDTVHILNKLNVKYSFISYLGLTKKDKNFFIPREDHMNVIKYFNI